MYDAYNRGLNDGRAGASCRSGERLGSFAHAQYRDGYIAGCKERGKLFLADTGTEIVPCDTIEQATAILDHADNVRQNAVA